MAREPDAGAESVEVHAQPGPGADGGAAPAPGTGASPAAPALVDAKHPAVEMLTVALPTVATMTSYTVMQFIDGLMVARIGSDDVYLAAQGNGGILMWVTIGFTLGLTSVINTYVSQHLGAGKPEAGSRYAWVGLYLSLVTALPMLLAIPFLGVLFELFGHDGQLLELETEYAQVLFAGAFVTIAARSIAHYFFGMHRPVTVLASVLVAQAINVVLNGVLIFGPDGPPADASVGPFGWFFDACAAIAGTLGIGAMGVSGAALGTVLGTAVELLIPLAIFLGPMHAKYATRAAWRCGIEPFKEVGKLGWPGGLMFLNEILCWAYLMAVLLKAAGEAAGDDGVTHNTAGWIALRYMHLSFMPAVGLSIGVTAIVGKCMGMGRADLARKRAMLGLQIGIAYMGACAAAFVIFREPMVRLFVADGLSEGETAKLVSIGSAVMIAAAVFQVFDAVAIVISGALRGAGDTVWPGIATVVLSWTCIVLGGHAMIAFWPSLGSLGPWIAASVYIVALGVALSVRFAGGKWATIELVKKTSPDPSA